MRRRAAAAALALTLSVAGCAGDDDGDPAATEPSSTTLSSTVPTPRADIRRKIGQMIMVGFRGLTLADAGPLADQISAGQVGGVVLFDVDLLNNRSPVRNVQSREQVRNLTLELGGVAQSPLVIATDQEGGRVARLKPSHGFPATRSAQDLGAGDPAQTRAQAEEVGGTLSNVGINTNLAPVVDVNVNPSSPAIGALGRSYSADPEAVTRHARAAVAGHRSAGVISVLKHFPGHGSATADSHLGIVDVTDTWSRVELEPYRALIASGDAQVVMTAHVFNRSLDPDWPSTLSPKVLDDILRKDLRFDGVVISDDMQMGAIQDHYPLEDAVRQALLAGVDMLMFANNNPKAYEPDIAPRVIDVIANLVERGIITEQRIDQSVARLAALRTQLRR